MFVSRGSLLGVFLFITIAGVALSYKIYYQGQQVDTNNTALLSEKLPVLHAVSEIEQALSEHERINYEFYATQDAQTFTRNQSQNQNLVDKQLSALALHSVDASVLSKIKDYIHQQRQLSEDLLFQLTRGTYPEQWDKSRALLSDMTNLGNMIRPQLMELSLQVEEDLKVTQTLSSEQLHTMSNLVIIYSMIIIGIAIFGGYQLSIFFKEAIEKKKLAHFVERNPNAVLSLDWNGHITYLNPAAELLEDAINFPSIFQQVEIKINELKSISQSHLSWQFNRHDLDFLATIHKHNDIQTFTLYLENITQRRKAERELEFLAFNDPLTSLPNRRRMELDGIEWLQQAESHLLALVVIGIDRFSQITTTHGYQVGDEILNSVKERIQTSLSMLPERDIHAKLYRFTGAKFTLLLKSTTKEAIDDWTPRLIQEVQSSLLSFIANSHGHFYLHLSFGVSNNLQSRHQFSQLLQNADAAYTTARKTGSNQICFFSDDMQNRERQRLQMETDLRIAKDSQQFNLVYQPKINTKTLKIMGVEALIRWQHPTSGFVSPAEFIPVAEQSGLIIEIGSWIIDQVCQQIAIWRQQKLSQITCAINISPLQFLHHDFIEQLDVAIAKHQVPSSSVELEITEGLLMHDLQRSVEILKQLHRRGFKISIDDFGTGYSSLAYLKLFPLDKLKIDKSFIDNISSNGADRSIVRTIIDLAKHLNLKVVAEGVETLEQFELLNEYQCDEIQGYYFSKPISAQAIIEFSHEH